jgi:hypothetical protein
MYRRRATEPLVLRSRDQIEALFAGWQILDPPGLPWVSNWWPDAPGMPSREQAELPAHRSWILGAVSKLANVSPAT